jgi:hypothetical protein
MLKKNKINLNKVEIDLLQTELNDSTKQKWNVLKKTYFNKTQYGLSKAQFWEETAIFLKDIENIKETIPGKMIGFVFKKINEKMKNLL